MFNGVTEVSATTDSAMPSPFVSQASVAAVDTVLPNLSTGNPVLLVKPWQMIVVSFGKNPHPTAFNCTLHSAFTNPLDAGAPAIGDGGVVNGPATAC
jgi:hypothetical protein